MPKGSVKIPNSPKHRRQEGELRRMSDTSVRKGGSNRSQRSYSVRIVLGNDGGLGSRQEKESTIRKKRVQEGDETYDASQHCSQDGTDHSERSNPPRLTGRSLQNEQVRDRNLQRKTPRGKPWRVRSTRHVRMGTRTHSPRISLYHVLPLELKGRKAGSVRRTTPRATCAEDERLSARGRIRLGRPVHAP